MSQGMVTVLVLQHPEGISQEGALHARTEALKAVEATGIECIAASTGYGEGRRIAWELIQESPDG